MELHESTANAPPELIEAWLKLPETRTREFKRVSGKMVGKALESLCAFVNSEGGVLVLGLGDAKEFKGQQRLFGIEENPEALDELRRKLGSEFSPQLGVVHWQKLSCPLHNGPAKGQAGHLLIIRVEKSDKVHSLVNNGTWTRLDASNRQMSATEVTELSYRRGIRSAASEPVPINLAMLQTEAWRRFVQGRGLKSGTFDEQLQRIGLAQVIDGVVQPTRAAVLLFADEPGSLLAAHDTRADIRLMVYQGKSEASGSMPTLVRQPKTIRGPLIDQIDDAVKAVLEELARGLVMPASGFKTRHVYPERVVKESIVNAVIHRDYRLNRDIFVRIFDDRVEIESPGAFPGHITAATIAKAGSRARNPLIAQNLREFPEAPNIDAGEGVRAMFSGMSEAGLYPPQYRESVDQAIETVTVTLLNAERPSAWDEVSDWLDRHGEIANADLCRIAGVDTLKASKMFKEWRDQGLLVPLPDRGKRNMAYTKPARGSEPQGLLSMLEENKPEGSEKPI